jgi:hypothetical protein
MENLEQDEYERRMERLAGEIEVHARDLMKVVVDVEARTRRLELKLDKHVDDALTALQDVVDVSAGILKSHEAELGKVRALWAANMQAAGTSAGQAYAKACGQEVVTAATSGLQQVTRDLQQAAAAAREASTAVRWRGQIMTAAVAALVVAVVLRWLG